MTDVTPTIPVAFYRSRNDSHPVRDAFTWEALAERLSSPVPTPCDPCDDPKYCTHKDGPAWSPVELHETCHVGPTCKDKRHKRGDVDHPAHRANDNVIAVHALVLDFDKLTSATYRAVLQALAPYRFILHSTHSHRPGKIAVRVAVALSRPVTRAEWPTFVRAAYELFGAAMDPACKDPSRLFYLPSVASGQVSRYLFSTGEGEPLDVEPLVAGAPVNDPASLTHVTVPDAPPVQVDYAELVSLVKDLKKSYKLKKDPRAAILEACLAGDELALEGGQSDALHRLASILAAKFPPRTHVDGFLAIARNSIIAMGPGSQGLDYWFDKAAKSYESAMERRLVSDAAKAEARAAENMLAETLMRAAKAQGAAKKAEPSEGAEEASEDAAGGNDGESFDWLRRLIIKRPGENGNPPVLESCAHNASTIFQHAPQWTNVLRFNEVTKEVDLAGEHPLDTEPDGQTLPSALADHLEFHWRVFLGEGVVRSRMARIARLNRYDPVKDSLLAVPWAGESLIDTFLERAAGAVLTSVDGEDISAHVRTISRRWFISAAARALRPGVKVDTILVLEGAQGVRKTSLFKALGGPFYASTSTSLVEKDGMMLAGRNWIIEIAELASFRRSEADALKAFFTSCEDQFRPPYGSTIETFPRRCVFVGTVNPEDGAGYLTDPTGNRRYWPVRVTSIDMAYVRQHRTQLWAEAAHYAQAALDVIDRDGDENLPSHLRWWLEPNEELVAAKEAASRVADNPLVPVIREWLLSMVPEKRPRVSLTHEIGRDALHLDISKATEKGMTMVIGRALKALGCDRRKARIHGELENGYFWPEALLTATTAPKRGTNLALVAGGKP